ncbi:hypothetical protein [Salarchaeum japonicum]|uniref:hypothetical protein n=1 Tax=Salarchaeum japonicum TaxID=555573 RepID=UPI003C79235D
MADTPPWPVFLLVVAAGIVLPGITRGLLAGTAIGETALVSFAGNNFTVGMLVWVVGYGSALFVLWYGWLRPLDLEGATGEGET